VGGYPGDDGRFRLIRGDLVRLRELVGRRWRHPGSRFVFRLDRIGFVGLGAGRADVEAGGDEQDAEEGEEVHDERFVVRGQGIGNRNISAPNSPDWGILPSGIQAAII
jgi:hypothetical protein